MYLLDFKTGDAYGAEQQYIQLADQNTGYVARWVQITLVLYLPLPFTVLVKEISISCEIEAIDSLKR